MRVLAVKNAKNEGLEYIEDVFESGNIELDYVMAESVDDVDEFEIQKYTHLIILGGPQGVYEAEEYIYLKREMEVIRRADQLRIPVLGICLGCQLIAGAFNAKVYPHIKELGWFEVENTGLNIFPEKMIVFQWHQDTFELPERAKLIFKGKNVKNQGFILRKNIGLQFHIEVRKETVEKWIESENISEEEKERIISETDEHISELNAYTEKLIDYFINL